PVVASHGTSCLSTKTSRIGPSGRPTPGVKACNRPSDKRCNALPVAIQSRPLESSRIDHTSSPTRPSELPKLRNASSLNCATPFPLPNQILAARSTKMPSILLLGNPFVVVYRFTLPFKYRLTPPLNVPIQSFPDRSSAKARISLDGNPS